MASYSDLERRVADRTRELESVVRELNFHIENTPLGVMQWDPDGRIQRWTKQAEGIFGWEPDEVERREWTEWPFPEADRNAIRELVERLMTGAQGERVHRLRLHAKNGHGARCWRRI